MSHAFVKEGDEQWLHDIAPTMNALINYLSRENNGIRVYEKSSHTDEQSGKQVHVMSNGMAYTVGSDGAWQIVDL
jgi:hypothetical protein